MIITKTISEILMEYAHEATKLADAYPVFATSIIQHQTKVIKTINDGCYQFIASCNVWERDDTNNPAMEATIVEKF